MRFRALLLPLLLCQSCLYKQLLQQHLCPAQLCEEHLELIFLPAEVRVTAQFTFYRSKKPVYMMCFFPARNFPVCTAEGTLPHPPVLNLKIHDGIIYLPLTRKNNRIEFPVHFKQRTRIRISYSTPYQRRNGKKEFRYVLRTGGWWQGRTIGKLTLSIRNRTDHSIRLSKPYRTRRIFHRFHPISDICARLDG